MNEIERRSDIPTTSSLSKMGIRAVGYSAAGIFVFILNAVTGSIVPALVIGGLVCLFGFASLSSKNSTDKKAGIIIVAAGALTILSKIGIPLITPLSGTLLGIGAFGLLALGIWNGIKFFLGLKKRS